MAKGLLKTSLATTAKEYALITFGLAMYALGWTLFLNIQFRLIVALKFPGYRSLFACAIFGVFLLPFHLGLRISSCNAFSYWPLKWYFVIFCNRVRSRYRSRRLDRNNRIIIANFITLALCAVLFRVRFHTDFGFYAFPKPLER